MLKYGAIIKANTKLQVIKLGNIICQVWIKGLNNVIMWFVSCGIILFSKLQEFN